jgi:hypothetical protein
MEKKEEKKGNNGCAIIVLVGFLFCLWGFTSLVSGHGFIEGITGNIKVIFIFGTLGFAIYGFARLNK